MRLDDFEVLDQMIATKISKFNLKSKKRSQQLRITNGWAFVVTFPHFFPQISALFPKTLFTIKNKSKRAGTGVRVKTSLPQFSFHFLEEVRNY